MSKAQQRIVSAFSAGKWDARESKKWAESRAKSKIHAVKLVKQVRNLSTKSVAKHFRGPYYAGFCAGMRGK